MSPPGCWVSQVAYRVPAASIPMLASIHVTSRPMRPAAGATGTGRDQVRPLSVEEVK